MLRALGRMTHGGSLSMRIPWRWCEADHFSQREQKLVSRSFSSRWRIKVLCGVTNCEQAWRVELTCSTSIRTVRWSRPPTRRLGNWASGVQTYETTRNGSEIVILNFGQRQNYKIIKTEASWTWLPPLPLPQKSFLSSSFISTLKVESKYRIRIVVLLQLYNLDNDEIVKK